VWRFILQDDGLLNALLGLVGINGPNWLNSTTWALPSLILMAVWRNMGTLMIIFLAGLQAIPDEVKEAASIDGATAWTSFRRITLPLLRPTLLLGAVLMSVGYLQFFEEPFVMTKGGPLDSTLSIVQLLYRTSFNNLEFGYGSAMGTVLLVILVGLSLANRKASAWLTR